MFPHPPPPPRLAVAGGESRSARTSRSVRSQKRRWAQHLTSESIQTRTAGRREIDQDSVIAPDRERQQHRTERRQQGPRQGRHGDSGGEESDEDHDRQGAEKGR